MSDELNRAYEALQKAHDAGDVEGAKQIAEYARSLEANTSKADNYEKAPQDEGLGIPESAVGAALGSTLGAVAGPAVGAAVDTATNIGAKIVNPVAAGAASMPGSNSPAAVRAWLKTQTSNPDAGGRTMEEAYKKSEIAAGKPVQSRGSKVPIRKGNLGITNQLPETTLPQKAAANIINAEKLGKPGVARRMAGMGVAGAEIGNMIEEAKQGHYGHAALSGLGALGGAATQSRIKPIRTIGTGLSVAVPLIQKFVTPDEEEQKAAGGLIQHYDVGSSVKAGASQVKKYSDIIQHHIGKMLHPTIVDTTKLDLAAGKMAGNEASNLQNISAPHKAEDWVFANDSMSAAKRLWNVNQRNDGNVVFTGLIGSPYQLKTNRSVFGDLEDEFYKAVAAGKLDPDLLKRYQTALASSTHKSKDEIVQTFPNKFDIRDRDAFKENSKLFHQRGALADIMGGSGPTGVPLGGKKGQIFDWEGVLNASRDPNTIGAPTQSIGTRLFTLNDRLPEYRTDLHNAFDYSLFGKDLKESFNPVNKEVGIPTALETIRQNNIAQGKKPDVTSMHIARNILMQPITDDYVKAVQAAGFADGGAVPHLAGGGDPLKGANVVKHSISQIPKVAQALEEYLKGNITKAEHMEAVRKHLPIRQWNELPPEYTDEQIRNALRSNQLDKALAPVPVGKETGNRLDINAYTNNDPPVFVDTVHDINDNNKVLSYNRTGHLKDVNFKSLPNSAVMMGLGTKEQALTPMGAQMGKSKAPIAMIEGTNVGTHDDEVRRMMAEMMKDPRYTQIGMDPRVGSQFYDKSTDRPIWTSGEKFQVGPLVMVPKKDIETTDWNDPRLLLKKFPGKTYKKGGLATLKKKK